MLTSGPVQFEHSLWRSCHDDGISLLSSGVVSEVEPVPSEFVLIKGNLNILTVVSSSIISVVCTEVVTDKVLKRPEEQGEGSVSKLISIPDWSTVLTGDTTDSLPVITSPTEVEMTWVSPGMFIVNWPTVVDLLREFFGIDIVFDKSHWGFNVRKNGILTGEWEFWCAFILSLVRD